MPKFDAGTVVEPLDYDFTRFVPNCEGTIPEPNDDDLRAFLRGMKDLARKISGQTDDEAEKDAADQVAALDPNNPDINKLVRFLDTFDSEATVELVNEMADLIGTLCHQQPAAEEIVRLPFRVRNAFIGWVVAGMTNPESSAAGTRP